MDFSIYSLAVGNELNNYTWILKDNRSHEIVVIDPTDTQIVREHCVENNLKISQIWITHWHKDHVGGVPGLLKHTPNIRVIGSVEEQKKTPMMTDWVQQGDQIYFNDLEINVFLLPGHTLGHIIYYVPELDAVFSGDMVFIMGCGRVFEGTYEQMYLSLNKLKSFPLHTTFYSAHDFSADNIRFVESLGLNNSKIDKRIEYLKNNTYQGIPNVSMQLALEIDTNPFLLAKNINEFIKIRTLKDNFK
ncbi:hydroxyacylglutathione hydrolase [Acinetobacter baumannii]|uniref:hydroxyacylglutathione hydrolase n=1 Tax=Acinetobacter baumannii TaxID=470 RepID=UPI002341373F|nr:hydroxyacylglutathione hydrolase [Acinetobacter baumannii]MDC4919620.1 hydroxyacylglutathione hydrolase [Acinetobacter baumannii]MDC4934150.1 hydroxyacylglutathione hydrolase [Acinetobacter baumannii]